MVRPCESIDNNRPLVGDSKYGRLGQRKIRGDERLKTQARPSNQYRQDLKMLFNRCEGLDLNRQR